MADPVTVATVLTVLKQIGIYVAAQLAYKEGVDPLLKKWKKSRSDPEVEDEVAKLKAEHDKLQQKLSQYQIAVNYQHSQLTPLLTELVQHTKTREQLTKLVELLKELVGVVSAERIEKRLDQAYDGLDAEQLKNRSYRYELPGGWYDDHYCFYCRATSEPDPPSDWRRHRCFLSVPIEEYRPGSPFMEQRITFDTRIRGIARIRGRRSKPLTLSYYLVKVSVENGRLAGDLEEIFNDPDLLEHHPEATEGIVEKIDTSFFKSLETCFENQRSARENLENLVKNLYDLEILNIITDDPRLEITGILDGTKLTDEWLKKSEKLTKKFNEMQALTQSWRKTTAQLLADDTISDKLRFVRTEEVVPAAHFLRFFDALIDIDKFGFKQIRGGRRRLADNHSEKSPKYLKQIRDDRIHLARDDFFEWYPKYLEGITGDSQPLADIVSCFGKSLSDPGMALGVKGGFAHIHQKTHTASWQKCVPPESTGHASYVRISGVAGDVGLKHIFSEFKGGTNYKKALFVFGDLWWWMFREYSNGLGEPLNAKITGEINTGIAFNILKNINWNRKQKTMINYMHLGELLNRTPHPKVAMPFEICSPSPDQILNTLTNGISFFDGGISLPTSLLNRRSHTRLHHALRRGEQSLEPLKRALLKPRKERIDKLCKDLGLTEEQIEKLMVRIKLSYAANYQSWATVKEAVDEWYEKAFNQWNEEWHRANHNTPSDTSRYEIRKSAFDKWSRESGFPPLWYINTPFGYKSSKRITEEGLEDLCAPLFKAQTDHWETVTIRRHEELLTIAKCDEAIRLNPEDINAYNNRGNAKFLLGQYKEAIADYDMALRINPKDANAYNNRKECQKKVVAELSDDFLRALKRS